MNHLKYRGLGISLSQKRRRKYNVVLVTFIAIVAIVLASCGSPAAGRTNQASPVPTITVVPSNTPTTAPALTPTSTPKPTTSPQATVTPTQPAAPAILDVRPSSMSIVGHLDCNRASNYVCLARVLSRADAQSDLHTWSLLFPGTGQYAYDHLGLLIKEVDVGLRIVNPDSKGCYVSSFKTCSTI